MIEGGKTPYLPPAALASIGFDFVVYPVSTLFAAAQGMSDALGTLQEQGTCEPSQTVSFDEFEEVIGTAEFEQLAEEYAK
jgi:2-methylisocitrate lyase-like PEP mutase family enzyme